MNNPLPLHSKTKIMSFINYLNKTINDGVKMVNTINKVDKLLTEKPKRPKTKYITKRFTEEEFELIKISLVSLYNHVNELHEPNDNKWTKLSNIRKLENKLFPIKTIK